MTQEKDAEEPMSEQDKMMAKLQLSAEAQRQKPHTLVVWCEDGSTYYYLIPEEALSEEHWKYLGQAHGKFRSAHETNEGIQFLDAALTEEDQRNDPDCFPDRQHPPGAWRGLFGKYRIDNPTERCLALDVNIASVCVTGAFPTF